MLLLDKADIRSSSSQCLVALRLQDQTRVQNLPRSSCSQPIQPAYEASIFDLSYNIIVRIYIPRHECCYIGRRRANRAWNPYHHISTMLDTFWSQLTISRQSPRCYCSCNSSKIPGSLIPWYRFGRHLESSVCYRKVKA